MMTSNLLTELFHPTTIITTSMLHFANNFGYCEKQSTEAVLLSDLSILGTGYNPAVLSCFVLYSAVLTLRVHHTMNKDPPLPSVFHCPRH